MFENRVEKFLYLAAENGARKSKIGIFVILNYFPLWKILRKQVVGVRIFCHSLLYFYTYPGSNSSNLAFGMRYLDSHSTSYYLFPNTYIMSIQLSNSKIQCVNIVIFFTEIFDKKESHNSNFRVQNPQ